MTSSNKLPPFLDANRLLSVQSHVVSGYVGNRAATFPLQLLGYDVDVVNTVQFSNHTGYGHTNGHKTTPEQLDAVFKGLETNGLCRWSRCLTGYIPGAPAVQAVGHEIEKLKRRAQAQGEDVLYLLDPVMGDIGKGLYVAEDVVPIYRQLLSLASIITPNQFETELLSETKIDSIPALYKALMTLHSPPHNVQHVVISSIPLPIGLIRKLDLPMAPESYTSFLPGNATTDTPASAGPSRTGSTASLDSQRHAFDEKVSGGIRMFHEQGDEGDEPTVLVCFASTRRGGRDDDREENGDGLETYGYALPTVQGYYSGVGDLFSALVLGHYQREPSSSSSTGGLERAVSLALLGVQQVLLKTHLSTLSNKTGGTKTARESNGETECIPSDDELDAEGASSSSANKDAQPGPSRRARRMRLRELRIVQERNLLMRLADDAEGGWKGARLDWQALLQEGRE